MYGDNDNNSIAGVERIDITNYLKIFLEELYALEQRSIDLKTKGGATRIKELMNISKNTVFKSLNDFRSSQPYWEEQEVDCISSNLGKNKGFIFYFICNRCKRRVKYLYFLFSLDVPLCRLCCRLQYVQPGRKTRMLSTLINRKYLSTEAKYMIMKKLGITKSDIENYLSDYEGA